MEQHDQQKNNLLDIEAVIGFKGRSLKRTPIVLIPD